jgi:hypothetical protein
MSIRVKTSSAPIYLLFIICTTIGPGRVLGQITGKSNTPDPRALAITADLQSRLVDRIWFGSQVLEVRRGTTENRERYHGSVTFDRQGKLIGQWDGEIGSWLTVNQQVVQITITKGTQFLGGAYSIYELTDSTLVLGQILTSTGDWTREHRFSQTALVRKRPPPYVNPVDLDSLKGGTRTAYHKNGRIKSVQHYKVDKVNKSAEDMFLHGVTPSSPRYDRIDSTFLQTVPAGTWVNYDSLGRVADKEYYRDHGRLWKYEQLVYRTKGTSPIMLRKFYSRPGAYVVGIKDTIMIDKVKFLSKGHTDSTMTFDFGLKNLSPHPITLEVAANPVLSLSPIQLTIAGGDSVTVDLPVKLPTGEVKELIWIGTAEWKTYLDVDAFGYHLTDSDFQSGKDKVLPQTFYILRDADSYQLEVARAGREQKPKLFPVSKQLSDVDLKKGRYQLTLVGPTSRKSIHVEVR